MHSPDDFLNPQWDAGSKTHNWHNYVSPELRAIWQQFTVEQRQILAANAEEIASNEEWE